jgi:hypothetical protein
MRKRFFICALSLCLFASMAMAETTRVSAIRIIDADEVKDWRDGENLPKKTPGKTAPSVVLSFIDLKPGMAIDLSELRQRCAAAERRLLDSGYFYDARVSSLPSRKDPGASIVVIEVVEGFASRFGGGNAYAMYGQDNWRGEGRSYRIYGGYNLDGLEYTDQYISVSAFYKNKLDGEGAQYHAGCFGIGGFFPITPDWKIGLLSGMKVASLTPMDAAARGESGLQWDFPLAVTIGGKTALGNPDSFSFRFSGDGRLGLIFPLTGAPIPLAGLRLSAVTGAPLLSLAAQGCAAWSGAPLPYLERFNIKDADDQSLRADYLESELFSDAYALINVELRSRLLHAKITSLIGISLSAFLYEDQAWLGRYSGGLAYAVNYGATGAGFRLAFDNPIFAAFSLSYGWKQIFNDTGPSFQGGALRFCATGGF